jgi:16S rRNA (uracil1498-N3)-methyltransferase
LIHIASAVPKGDRAAQLIDQLAQTGATSWSPLVTDHGVAEAGQHKLDRFTRIAREGAKQCGRAHTLHIGPERTLAAALRPGPEPALPDAPAVDLVLIADASGQPPGAIGPVLASARAIRVLVGPEGGWSGAERAAFGASPGARMLVCGPHVMRIETAAVAAVVALRCAGGQRAD